MARDLVNAALSFAHAIVRVDDRLYTGVRAVHVNQELNESAVYGTDIGPLKRSLGQVQMGRGQLIFSDTEDAFEFVSQLGASGPPFQKIWSLDYILAREDGLTKRVEALGCRITTLGLEHEAGADALEVSFPFSFLALRVDGQETALSPRTVLNAAVSAIAAGRGIANLFNS